MRFLRPCAPKAPSMTELAPMRVPMVQKGGIFGCMSQLGIGGRKYESGLNRVEVEVGMRFGRYDMDDMR
jgi:hypothetical protein